MREKGAIILALLFILILVGLGIFFIYQVYLEEDGSVSRQAGDKIEPTQQPLFQGENPFK